MSEQVPIISVIIPTHNRAEYLIRLLDSLSRQTLAPEKFEILVIHNFTEDGTQEQVAEWAGNKNVALTYYKKNYKGPAASRDFGARKAKGAFIAFIDDDCISTPEWLEKSLMSFSESNVGLVQGRTLPRPDQSRHLLEKTVCIEKASLYFETCNIVYSKKVFLQVGGFSPEFIDKFYGEDTDLGWKVKKAGFKTKFNRKAIVYHEVFRVSYWQWLKEPLFFKNIPYLVKKNPELRKHMCAYYFLSSDTAMFYFIFAGLITGILTKPFWGLVIATPYFLHRYRTGKHMQNPILKLLRIIFGLPRGFLMWWALLKGSIQAGSILL